VKTYRDIAGDGGSGIVSQVVAHRQAMQRALAGVRHVVAVASGKGGVGKSTVTLGLGRALAASGRRVAILDADLNGPCQAQLAGIGAAPWVPGERGIDIPRDASGIGVISVGSVLDAGAALRFDAVSQGDEQVWRASRELTVIGQLLAGVAWGELDALLLDLPPGAERTLQMAQLLGTRAAFVLVTVPSAVARGVVTRSLDALVAAQARVLGYVENMAGYLCPGCDELRPLFGAGEPLPLPLLAAIPFDPVLAASAAAGSATSSPAVASAFAAAADAVMTRLEVGDEVPLSRL
jgi:ATP-binding protein involved in chromosome partitioning